VVGLRVCYTDSLFAIANHMRKELIGNKHEMDWQSGHRLRQLIGIIRVVN